LCQEKQGASNLVKVTLIAASFYELKFIIISMEFSVEHIAAQQKSMIRRNRIFLTC
jgi:hypothetical protein